jgi:hypothetical protein
MVDRQAPPLLNEQSLLFLHLLHLQVMLRLYFLHLVLVLLLQLLPLKLLLHECVAGILHRRSHCRGATSPIQGECSAREDAQREGERGGDYLFHFYCSPAGAGAR